MRLKPDCKCLGGESITGYHSKVRGLVLADMLEVQLRTSRDSSSSSPEWKPKLRERKFACTICGESFNHLKLLIDHANDVHDGEYRHKCEECRTAFSSKRTLRAHRKEVHPAGPYKCAECEKVFQIESVFKKHQETHLISPEDLTCHRCDRRILRSHGWHVKSSGLIRCGPAGCTSFRWARKVRLLLKAVLHSSHLCRYSPSCTSFAWSISSFKWLKDSPQIVHANFLSRNLLKSHERKVHRRNYYYTCDTCGKQIADLQNFQNHLRVHMGEKPFECSYCEKRFTNGNLLRIHERVHNGEKPYACDLCDKRFTQRSSLTVHLRRHAGEKPYVCPVCEKSFASKSNLNAHVKTHK
ncbi:zinc finger protein 84-like [Photinus pyralis]|uniref:zinc finger protein 84-like n=1 Tax=Photinus pyralis TaxID=7054 RepID=UPI0012672171|nr:zinc finger protein 84-like [Photinus pyralis]